MKPRGEYRELGIGCVDEPYVTLAARSRFGSKLDICIGDTWLSQRGVTAMGVVLFQRWENMCKELSEFRD